jgi:hypothetical protein
MLSTVPVGRVGGGKNKQGALTQTLSPLVRANRSVGTPLVTPTSPAPRRTSKLLPRCHLSNRHPRIRVNLSDTRSKPSQYPNQIISIAFVNFSDSNVQNR